MSDPSREFEQFEQFQEFEEEAPPQDTEHAMYQYATTLLHQGKKQREIEESLVRRGMDPTAAAALASQVFSHKATGERASAKRWITIGAIAFVLGTLLTVGTFTAAAEDGGTYIIAWGPIVFGGFFMLRGFFKLASVRADTEPHPDTWHLPRKKNWE